MIRFYAETGLLLHVRCQCLVGKPVDGNLIPRLLQSVDYTIARLGVNRHIGVMDRACEVRTPTLRDGVPIQSERELALAVQP